jgi:hypothetical protein
MNPLTDHIIVNLTGTGLIKIEGADAQNFLHNQFTNDLRQVNEQSSQLSSYCSPKGRILALFRIFKHGDAYYMALPRTVVEPTLKRLRMFVLMSKVTLTDLSSETGHLGFSGPESAAQLKRVTGEIPDDMDGVSHHDQVTIIHIPGPQPRFELFGPKEQLAMLQQALATHASTADANSWELLDIHAAIPTIHPQNVEAFVPQMVNLQAIKALNFKKGCYPGQEIVARMQYLGKLKRRMYLAHVDSATPPQPGDTLFGPETPQGEAHQAGTVVTAQLNPNGGCDLLAVLEIEAAENAPIHLASATGPTLALLDLPYPLTA